MNSARAVTGAALAVLLAALGLAAVDQRNFDAGDAGCRTLNVEWEYKVLGDISSSAETLQQRFNQLSAEGWEYVGPTGLFDGRHDCSVFRKPKTK